MWPFFVYEAIIYTFTAQEVIPHLFHRVDLQQEGRLIAKLSEQEARNLCRLEYVAGRMGKAKGGAVALRWLELQVPLRTLHKVLCRVAVKTLAAKAEDSCTTFGKGHKISHDMRKCRAYRGVII